MNERKVNKALASSSAGRRVVVLGGSIAGLLAARVLSAHADEVVVVERDALAPHDSGRKGVPQGRHAHGLLGRGQVIFESLFPGLTEELRDAGAVFADQGRQRWTLGGNLLALPKVVGWSGFTCARPVLESCVRARVRALPNVVVRDATDVVGLTATSGRVTGVQVMPRTDGAAAEWLEAALVVDATGRGSKLPAWLAELGFDPPDEERVKVDVRYATVIARRRPEHARGASVVVVAAAPPNRRSGVALAIDADHWIITLPGYLGESAGQTWEELVEFARGLPSNDLYNLMRESAPVSGVVPASFPHSQWRRYDRLRRHPSGVVAFGDALCSFNPILGQGMTVAALEAMALADVLERTALPAVWRDFYARTRAIVDVPWSMAVGNDLRFAEVDGRRSHMSQWLAHYLDRLLRVAATDPTVGEAFLRVIHLLKAPSTLLKPSIMLRVARGPMEPSAHAVHGHTPAS